MKVIKNISYLSFMPLLVGICFTNLSHSFAQKPKEIRLNDTLPDLEVLNLTVDNPLPLRTKSLYENGLLIINFWATWCVPCVKELTFLRQEIKKHPGKLHVLSVAYEDKGTVQGFLLKHPEIANSDLKIITDDQVFTAMFPHQAIPHNVWIDQTGQVKWITGGDEINAVNIGKILSNDKIEMNLKKDEPFDSQLPLHIPDSLIEFRSIFKKQLDNVNISGSTIDLSKLGRPNMRRFFGYNLLIKDLFWPAYQMPGIEVNDYLMEVQTTDSAKFFWPGADIDPKKYKGISRNQWGKNNQYTYELRAAKPIPDSIFFKHVINDLELNLELTTFRKLRKKSCCFVKYNRKSKLIHPANKDERIYLGIIGHQLIIKNKTIDQVLDWVVQSTYKSPQSNGTFRKEPYINKTKIGYPFSASIDLGNDSEKYHLYDHLENCLREQLGLTFEIRNNQYPVLVIKDHK